MLGMILQRGIRNDFYSQEITALGWGGPGPDLTYRVSVVMYGCENWTIKKAEPQRIDAFKLWYWRRLENPLDSKEIKPVKPKGNKP